MPGRGLPRPETGASPTHRAPSLRVACSCFSSPSRCFPGKRSLPLCSPLPGCRKEVTGTFPLLLFARPCSDEEQSNSQVWVNSPIHFQQNPICPQAPPDSALFFPPHHAPNPTVGSLRPNTLQFSHKNCQHTHVHM